MEDLLFGDNVERPLRGEGAEDQKKKRHRGSTAGHLCIPRSWTATTCSKKRLPPMEKKIIRHFIF
jgi:hypothetical protein